MVKRNSPRGKTASRMPQARKDKDTPKASLSEPRSVSKQADVISLLNRPQGVTIPAIIKKTGWQQHTVRGFFAAIVRKRLGLTLASEKTEGSVRVYRIVTKQDLTPKTKSAKGAKAQKANASVQQTAAHRVH